MADFVSAALPWIILGLGVAVAVVHFNREEKNQK